MKKWVQGFFLFLFLAGKAGAEEPYFYKNKFPGMTCVPLSFYISTQLGSSEAKSFWNKVEGEKVEDKFDTFLNECSYFYNPGLKNKREAAKKKAADTSSPKVFETAPLDSTLMDFANNWEDSPWFGLLGGILPIYTTVQNEGMWLADLLKVIQKLNPEYAEKLGLEFQTYAQGKNTAPPFVRMYYLKKRIEASLKNSFLPVMTWDNLFRDSSLDSWGRGGGHAITITGVDEVEKTVADTRLKFKYIDNEDGIERDGYFYLVTDTSRSSLEAIDPDRLDQIHVSVNYLRPNRLFTLSALLLSTRQ